MLGPFSGRAIIPGSGRCSGAAGTALPLGLLIYLLFWGEASARASPALYSMFAVIVSYYFSRGYLRKLTREDVSLVWPHSSADGCSDAAAYKPSQRPPEIIIGTIAISGGWGFILSPCNWPAIGEVASLLAVDDYHRSVAPSCWGSEMPTAGVYAKVVAVLMAPALIQMGIEPIAAHFIHSLFGLLSMITPPGWAVASYAWAASIANSNCGDRRVIINNNPTPKKRAPHKQIEGARRLAGTPGLPSCRCTFLRISNPSLLLQGSIIEGGGGMWPFNLLVIPPPLSGTTPIFKILGIPTFKSPPTPPPPKPHAPGGTLSAWPPPFAGECQ